MTKSARTDNAPVTVRYDGPPILHLHDPAGDRPGNRRSLFGLEPRPPDAVKLVASEFWRLRVAALRVVYAIDERRLAIVLRIARRAESTYRRVR
jgi:hypothetical protein